MRRSTPGVERFLERLIAEGKLLATQKDLAGALLDHFDLHPMNQVLAEGGRTVSVGVALRELLNSMQVKSPDERLAALTDEKVAKDGTPSYAEAFRQVQFEHPDLAREAANLGRRPTARRMAADAASKKLTDLAEEKVRRGDISFSDALIEASRENPTLAREYVGGF